jgi:transposase-like protein
MLQSKKGVSALQIRRTFFGERSSTHTAWFVCMRLRAAMHDDGFKQLMGIVEIDEVHLGGKQSNRHWKDRQKYHGGGSANTGKTTVIGAISRKGNVNCKIIENASQRDLQRFARKVVSDKVDLVATDSAGNMQGLRYVYPHEMVDHKCGEYVRGIVHTNNIESFWALLKRGVMGTYHNVSAKYLPLYLAEFQFRHNHRKDADIFGEAVAGC